MSSRHIITGEYPPDVGGVADYTRVVAAALATSGEDVHVWCGGASASPAREGAVTVHRSLGGFDRHALAQADRELEGHAAPRRLLVQWVPHAYSRSSINVGFCRWVRRRARLHGDTVEVMIHEPFLPFEGGVRQRAAALVHRLMIRLLLSEAKRVWVAIPEWETLCRPFAPKGRFAWMPIPSGIEVITNPPARDPWRTESAGSLLLGSFGRTGDGQARALARCLDLLERQTISASLLLIGAGSERLREQVLAIRPSSGGAVRATGALEAADVSAALRACDIVVQPYDDGVCGRRSSAMACLAHGLPMVSVDGRFTEPSWRNVGVRLVARVDDVPAEVAALARDAAARSRLASGALALYDQCFDVRHTVAALQAELQAS